MGILLTAAQVGAQTNSGWANKLFTEAVHNFGVVPHGAQLKHSFAMKNIWKVPLKITDIRVTCGCLKAEANPSVLSPGQTGTLDITMDGTRFLGPKTINIFVTVGPQFVSVATLVVSATTRHDVVFNPPNGIQFGQIPRGQTIAKAIEVVNGIDSNWAVLEIAKSQVAPFELKVENLPPTRGKGYIITATIKADAAAGDFKEEIVLKTNNPNNPTLNFSVAGSIRSAVTISPNPVRLSGLKVGAGFNTPIVVAGTSGQPFRIVQVKGLEPGIDLPLPTGGANNTHLLNLRIQPNQAGEIRRTLLLVTDSNETVPINIEGTVQP